MVIRLILLALTSMWWIGCSGSSPSAGSGEADGGAMLDPERAQACKDLCRAQTAGSSNDSPYLFCLSECVSLVPFAEFDHWVLAGAEATVKIRETFGFGVAFNDQRLLTSCSISQYALAGTELRYFASTNFRLAEPRESADYFSFTSFPDMDTGDQVIWGLYDRSSGEEWSGSPGGQVNVSCRILTGLEIMVCDIDWLGDAVKNVKPGAPTPSSVSIECFFVPPELACSAAGVCDDEEPCTDDLCVEGGCEYIEKDRYHECVVEMGGGPGVCSEGLCIPSTCGESCNDADLCTQEYCDLQTGVCVSTRAPYPQCQPIE